ncbi:MAG: conjugal transfer protein TraD [Kaiparowitsia implicata GSE-PSE-MK54-09C]|nr:conjugal transfer protein TraD [Kaiparowitsia implicata GSE-PSE-MK54-09C]
MREWQVKRRERTRQLIELGGLVVKAGLVELTDDDRALRRVSHRCRQAAQRRSRTGAGVAEAERKTGVR